MERVTWYCRKLMLDEQGLARKKPKVKVWKGYTPLARVLELIQILEKSPKQGRLV